MKVKLIVAVDLEGGIGKNNDLMWHLPADMKFFKETTLGQIVVMGRKNFESIPEKYRPLPGRENVILTRQKDFQADNCLVFHSLETCLKHFEQEENRIVYIIGGGQIYKEALSLNCIDEMYISHVQEKFDADTFFPIFNANEWKSSTVFVYETDEKNKFPFTVKRYIRK